MTEGIPGVDTSGADVRIVTSGGRCFAAHTHVLASASTVLEKQLERAEKRRTTSGGGKTIRILGVPCDAVSAFLSFIYTSRCSAEEMERYGVHLLVLSHVYCVGRLKRECERGLARTVTAESVVDLLQLARMCDAAYLKMRCLKVLEGGFKEVEATEGWKFLQAHDPFLELELLQFLDDAESRKKRRMRSRDEQGLYMELNEAMDCLEHICMEGCTTVGPHDGGPPNQTKKGPCQRYSTCMGLQLLIRHFATCGRKVHGGCSRCKRLWQLLRLHSSICERPEPCKVPLCEQFKMKLSVEKKGEDGKWRLLVRKVVSAKAISSLSQRERKLNHNPTMVVGWDDEDFSATQQKHEIFSFGTF
ncbi:BTB/POZ and TAZ domain-containing protein 1 [Acorus gramineus]|uniref:BTB/POZ and TAZ domain-containing protein 1 n=1 Tax=Acorus gramineus TaxID=55184 RepID=A0AAV8ZXL1_ACOGR|nr:BTB/POZ and TAZ domain-containing protein 1 [Acorus gramineus]